MTVLYLSGKPIDWHNPPKPTDKVLWSQRTVSGKKIIGSFRAIAHLDRLQALYKRRFGGRTFRVIQSMNNTGVTQSAGTHDYDFCVDLDGPGVSWNDFLIFMRWHGMAGWVRTPAQGFSYHFHGFCLPPREGRSISDDFKVHGFKVGKYVDGGYSTVGRLITSSQIADVYAHAFGLSGKHVPGSDKSPYPKSIAATVWDLNAHIRRTQGATPPPAPKPPAPAPKPDTPLLSVRQVALQVLDGKWGNGPDRERRLRSAGYNVREVQRVVNQIVAERNKPAPKPPDPPAPKPPTPPAPKPEPAPVSGNHVDIRVGHLSMQYSDNEDQWRSDAEKVFARGYEWVTGTEAGEKNNFDVLSDVANRFGYKIARFRDCWIAVNKAIMEPGTWKVGSVIVVDNDKTWGKGHDTVVFAASFTHKTPGVGDISVMVSHYPLRGWPGGPPERQVNTQWTRKTAQEIGAMAKRLGAGTALAFYQGDQNIPDSKFDTFFGEALISVWDTLKKWPNTGHGNIDVIARSKRDGRTSFVQGRAFTDVQMHFHTDHFLIEATIRVALLPVSGN
jgi:hypothetical protein